MANNRGNNEGTVYQRDSRKWRARVTLDGNRLSHTADSCRECAAWLKATIERIDEGLTYTGSQVPLKDFLSSWTASCKGSWRRTTWRQYRYVVREFIIPDLGEIELIDLQPRQIQRLYNGLLEEGVGVQSLSKVHTVLHSALSYAVKTGALGRNPASATIPPVPPTREMDILEEIQVNQLLIAAKGHRLEALFHLAVTTRMRQMELLGLKWGDIDWERQSLVVLRQLARRSYEGRQAHDRLGYDHHRSAQGSLRSSANGKTRCWGSLGRARPDLTHFRWHRYQSSQLTQGLPEAAPAGGPAQDPFSLSAAHLRIADAEPRRSTDRGVPQAGSRPALHHAGYLRAPDPKHASRGC